MIDNKCGDLKGRFLRLCRAGIGRQRRGPCGSRKPDATRSDNSHSVRDRDFNGLRQFVRPQIIDIHVSKTCDFIRPPALRVFHFHRGRYEHGSYHRQRPYRGFSNTSGEVIGTPSFEGGTESSSINSFLRRLQGHSLAKATPRSQTPERFAQEEPRASPAARSHASVWRAAAPRRSSEM